MKLTPKQRAFCDFYIETSNAYQSAIKAGYSNTYAKGNVSKLLENVRVKEYIEEQMNKMRSERIANAKEVLAFLSASMRGKIEEEVVSSEADGKRVIPVVVKKQLSAKDRIKAAELIGKRYTLFTDKLEVEEVVPVVISGENELEY